MMNADTLTMLCREGGVEANDSFQRQFSPSCNFCKMSFETSMILPAALSGRFLFSKHWCLCVCVANAALVALSHTYRGWRASFSARFWTSGIYFYVYYDGTATISTIGRRAKSVVGCKPVFLVLMDAAVFAYTFPRPSVVMKCNQLYSEMRNVRACFYDVTSRMLCFVLQDS